MQVSRREAARALLILRRGQRRTWARRRRRVRPRRASTHVAIDRATTYLTPVDDSTIELAHRRLLDDGNWVSIQRIQEARVRLDEGEAPSSEVIAEMIVRRAICDRLS
jgi:hypothetical protein